jgi:hypothetical protein
MLWVCQFEDKGREVKSRTRGNSTGWREVVEEWSELYKRLALMAYLEPWAL